MKARCFTLLSFKTARLALQHFCCASEEPHLEIMQ